MNDLSAKLKERMQIQGISAHRLEQEAGLKRSAVQNILHGRSRKPSAEILHAIAKILGCSITDLLGDPSSTISWGSKKATVVDETLNFRLYDEAVKRTYNVLKKEEQLPSKQKTLEFINEIYQYSIDNKIDAIDMRFASWLAQKWWGIESS